MPAVRDPKNAFEFSTEYMLDYNAAEWKRTNIREGRYYTWLKQQKQQKVA